MATPESSPLAASSSATQALAAQHAGLGEMPAQAYALTDSQKEILAMLEDRPHSPTETVLEAATGGAGLDVVFASVGVASMVAGAVLVFFFAALGGVLLVLGAIFCAVAFEHVALRDLKAEESALEASEFADAAALPGASAVTRIDKTVS